jgi:hypothetical protein
MTTKPPPLFFFNTITFNSGYYTIVDEATLTESKADSRYLIKTQTDTTNQLQTFNSGITFSGIINGPSIICSLIKTENLQSTSNSIPLLIGNNQQGVNGRIDIGCNIARNGNINIANTQTTGTGNIIIGSDALTGGGTQTITINRPLNLGYQDTPTTLSQLGGTVSTTSSIQPTSVTGTSLISFVGVPAGVYMVYYFLQYSVSTGNAVFEKQQHGLTSSQNTFGVILSNVYSLKTNSITVPISPSANEIVYIDNNSGILVLTTTTNVYLTYLLVKSGTGVPSVITGCRLCRIG